MTIYVSLPITGHDLEEQKRLAEKARERLMELDEESQVVTPFDVADYVEAMNPKAEYADYMAADIAFIIKDADTVCFLVHPIFTRSKGVRLEYFTAKLYGKKIKIMRP